MMSEYTVLYSFCEIWISTMGTQVFNLILTGTLIVLNTNG